MNRIVNGKKVELSPEEEAEILAEWAANDLKKEAELERAAMVENAKAVFKDQNAPIKDRLDALALIL